jgi:hypothetical protein
MAGDLTFAGKGLEGCFPFADGKGTWPAPPGVVLGYYVFIHLIQVAKFSESFIDKLPAAITVSVHLALPVLGAPARAVKQALGTERDRTQPAGILHDALTAQGTIFSDEIVVYRLAAEDGIAPRMDYAPVCSVHHSMDTLPAGKDKEGVCLLRYRCRPTRQC